MTLPVEQYRTSSRLAGTSSSAAINAFCDSVWQHAYYIETNKALAMPPEQRERVSILIRDYRDALMLNASNTQALGTEMIEAFGENYASLAKSIRRDIDSSWHIHSAPTKMPG